MGLSYHYYSLIISSRFEVRGSRFQWWLSLSYRGTCLSVVVVKPRLGLVRRKLRTGRYDCKKAYEIWLCSWGNDFLLSGCVLGRSITVYPELKVFSVSIQCQIWQSPLMILKFDSEVSKSIVTFIVWHGMYLSPEFKQAVSLFQWEREYSTACITHYRNYQNL
jgi:hypothetical protein